MELNIENDIKFIFSLFKCGMTADMDVRLSIRCTISRITGSIEYGTKDIDVSCFFTYFDKQ